jgi:hypothetical protein
MSGHTPGPWRWNVNPSSKSVSLDGGRPEFDKTVVDFHRWGMSSAAPRFNSAIVGDEFNIMFAAHEYKGWLIPFAGREHHSNWAMNINHPDARLIAAAPDLLEALRRAVIALDFAAETSPAMHDDYKAVSAAIAKATGDKA